MTKRTTVAFLSPEPGPIQQKLQRRKNQMTRQKKEGVAKKAKQQYFWLEKREFT